MQIYFSLFNIPFCGQNLWEKFLLFTLIDKKYILCYNLKRLYRGAFCPIIKFKFGNVIKPCSNASISPVLPCTEKN